MLDKAAKSPKSKDAKAAAAKQRRIQAGVDQGQARGSGEERARRPAWCAQIAKGEIV